MEKQMATTTMDELKIWQSAPVEPNGIQGEPIVMDQTSNLFAFHKLNDDGQAKAKEIAGQFQQLAGYLSGVCIQGREWSIVKTKLEEACFYAKKSMATDLRNQGTEDVTPQSEFFWVLENERIKGLFLGRQCGELYVAVGIDEAIKFPTKESAKDFLDLYEMFSDKTHKFIATEHGYIASK